MAGVHGVGVHDPGHGLLIGVHVGRGDVDFRADELEDLGGIAARDALELAGREQTGIADDAAFSAAEGNVGDGALPGHPGGQGADFIEGDVGRVADAALGGAARDGMLDAIAGEDFQTAVVEHDRNVHDDFARRRAQHLLHAVVQAEARGGFVESRFGGTRGLNSFSRVLRGSDAGVDGRVASRIMGDECLCLIIIGGAGCFGVLPQ